jgi:hypothetical protein
VSTKSGSYQVSAWNSKLRSTEQRDLIITTRLGAVITVDDLRIAQFIYLLLEYKQIRDVLDTITAKAVLILGSFTDERKQILDAMRDELRGAGYLPILFDLAELANLYQTETLMTLVGISRFVIADVTDVYGLPQEMDAIVTRLSSVPIRPIVQSGAREIALLEELKSYPWVIDTYEYQDTPQLLAALADEVINPAEAKVAELRQMQRWLALGCRLRCLGRFRRQPVVWG